MYNLAAVLSSALRYAVNSRSVKRNPEINLDYSAFAGDLCQKMHSDSRYIPQILYCITLRKGIFNGTEVCGIMHRQVNFNDVNNFERAVERSQSKNKPPHLR
jgi:hypothetical protein